MRHALRGVTCCLLVIVISSCKPVPESPKPPADRAWLPQDVDEMVVMEEVLIPSPAPQNPFINIPAPESCNFIHCLRFRLRDNEYDKNYSNNLRSVVMGAEDFRPVDIADLSAVMVLMPGILEGNNGFEYFGRQLVYMAKTFKNAKIEVWALDRRPNCVEDLTGSNAAEREKDTQIAIDYYWNGKEVDGKIFSGHPTDADLPFLSEFGLSLVINDLHTLITTIVPDQSDRKRKVFVGGHSLAGFITALYAQWDFDGNPETLEDAGFENCAGFIALDTVIASTAELLNPLLAFSSSDFLRKLENLTEVSYLSLVQGIRLGIVPRALPLYMAGMSPEAMTMMEIIGMRANWEPNKESTLLKDIPYAPNVDLLLSILHSKNMIDFVSPSPCVDDFRYTNEALVGIVFDDNFMPITIMQASMGFLTGNGTVVKKNFPLPEKLMDYLPNLSELFSSMLSYDGLFIADDPGDPFGTGPLYSWANFDTVGDSDDPLYMSTDLKQIYTTMIEEVTDIQDFSRMMYTGPSNLAEWYFTMRLTLDLVAATFPFGTKYGLNCIHEDKTDTFPPKIEFIAEKGPFFIRGGTIGRPDIHPIAGYNHFDVLTAAADRPGHRENQIMMPLIEFVLSISN